MSLTRDQWLEQWNDVVRLERMYHAGWPAPHSGYRREFRDVIARMKYRVESVIGQLEFDSTGIRPRP